MLNLQALEIRPGSTERTILPAQKRFNTLLRQIDKARHELTEWRAHEQAFRTAHHETVGPLQAALIAGRRRWVQALDAALRLDPWNNVERRTLRELLCLDAWQLLESGGPDPGLKRLFDQHSDVDFDTLQRQQALALKHAAERMTGLDLGDVDGLESPADVYQRLQQGRRDQAAAEEAEAAARAARASPRRKTAAQQRREAEAREATQSVREAYRKLASALHPDREADERLREEKTALMQRVNRAYESNDLLALLELQLQVEQIDASHIAGASEQRLMRFNKVLEEQLEELLAEAVDLEAQFRLAFDLAPGPALNPRQFGPLLQQTRRLWQADLDQQQRELHMLQDPAATKRWLKRQRQHVRRAAEEALSRFQSPDD